MILSTGEAKIVPSSSQSPIQTFGQIDGKMSRYKPVTNGILAASFRKTNCCGLSVRKTPSTRGVNARAIDLKYLSAIAGRQLRDIAHTW